MLLNNNTGSTGGAISPGSLPTHKLSWALWSECDPVCPVSIYAANRRLSFPAMNLCRNVHILSIVPPNRAELCPPDCVSALFFPLSNTYSKPTDLCHSGSLERSHTDKKCFCPAAAGSHTHTHYYTLLFHIMSCGLTLSAVAKR